MNRHQAHPPRCLAWACCLALVCLALLAPRAAFADTLKIVTIQLPPYGFTVGNQPTGLNYEIGNAIARSAGLTPDNTILPFARALEDVASGEADMVIMFPNKTIDTHAVNLGLVLPMETVVIGRADSVLRTFRDLRGKTVATVRGARYDDRISKRNGLILYPTDNYSQSLRMLLAKRVDAVVGPALGLAHAARINSVPKQALGTPLVLSVAQGNAYLSKSNTTKDLTDRLARAIQKLTRDGTIRRILDKYAL